MRIFHSFIGILLLFLLKIRQHPPQIKILFSNLVFLEGSWERTSIHSWWCRWIYSPLISKVFTEYSRVCATKFSFLHHLLFFGVKKIQWRVCHKKGEHMWTHKGIMQNIGGYYWQTNFHGNRKKVLGKYWLLSIQRTCTGQFAQLIKT